MRSPRSSACSRRKRPAMPARSIRSPPACCRSRSARRPRPCPTSWTGEKAYRFTVRWGEETDTDDAEGRVVATSRRAARPRRDQRAAAALHRHASSRCRRAISAIKIDGERAYDLARDGEVVELRGAHGRRSTRSTLVEQPDADHAVFEAECGKGTYVRAIARDLGRELGCSAMSARCAAPASARSARTHDHARRARALHARGRRATCRLDRVLLPVGRRPHRLCLRRRDRAMRRTLARGQSVILRGRERRSSEGIVYATAAAICMAVGRDGERRVRAARGCSIWVGEAAPKPTAAESCLPSGDFRRNCLGT